MIRPESGGLRPMFFVHIPKTAGTSLRTGVSDFLGAKQLVLDYGTNLKATSRLVLRLRDGEVDRSRFRQLFDAREKKFLSGHVALADYVGGFDLDNVAVFVRDPVQRIVSEFHHYRRHYGYNGTLEEFVDRPGFDNKQTRALAGTPIERIGFVGLAERFDESLERLNAHFGWTIPGRKANLGRPDPGRDYDIEGSVRRRIEANNALDLELYRRAVERFDRRDGASGPERTPAIGSCRLTAEHLLHGWACAVASERPTAVRIEVNGAPVTEILADRYRADIQARGLKRSGCAGFEVRLAGLERGDAVRCIETGGGADLNNSPLTVE